MHKKGFLAILATLICANTAFADLAPNWHGIHLRYRAQKMGTTVVKATLTIEHDGPLYTVRATVDSSGLARPVFKMHNRFTSYCKHEGLEPWIYIKDIDQRGVFSKKKRYTDILVFNPSMCKVRVEHLNPSKVEEVSLPPDTYDPLGVFLKYFIGGQVTEGEKITMRIYDGVRAKEVTFTVTAEDLITPFYGPVKAIALESKVPFSTLGDREGVIKIWYSADAQRIPIAMDLDLPSIGIVSFALEGLESW